MGRFDELYQGREYAREQRVRHTANLVDNGVEMLKHWGVKFPSDTVDEGSKEKKDSKRSD